MAYQLSTSDIDNVTPQTYQLSTNDIDNLNTQQLQSQNPALASQYNQIQSGAFGNQLLPFSQVVNNYNQAKQGDQAAIKIAAGTMLGLPVEAAVGPALASYGLGGEGAGLLGSIANKAITGAASGTVGSIPTSLSMSPQGSLNYSVPNTIAGGIGGGVLGGIAGAFRPGTVASILGGTATPEQVAANQALVPAGINVPAGQIINSPKLNSTYSLLGLAPFSGAGKPYASLNNFFSDAMDQLNPASESNGNTDFDQIAYNDMKNNYETAKQNTSNLYSQYNNAAQSLGNINFDRTAFDNAINSARQDVNSNIVNATTAKLYKPVSEFLDDYQQTPINDFNTARALDKGITTMMQQPENYNNSEFMRVLSMVKGNADNPGGLYQSMDDTASQYPSISGLYQQAKQARIDQGQFESFNDKPTLFSKMYGIEQKSPTFSSNNFISKSIPMNSDNNADQINSVMNNLSPEGQNAVRADILTPKPNSTNPLGDQVSKVSKLQSPVQQAIFGEQAPLAQQVQGLNNMYPKGRYPGYIEPTGWSGAKFLALLHPKVASVIPAAIAARATINSDIIPSMYLKSLQNASNAATPGTLGPLMRNAALQSTLAGVNNQ